MTDATATDKPSPAGALEQRFEAIWHGQMNDVPIVNRALRVEAVGFRPWSDHWLGILVTPWFMNLVLMPRVQSQWQPIGERESRHYAFPAGVFEFIGGLDPVLGDYQACSLFSPMAEFADPGSARDTAAAAFDALFDTAAREAGEVTIKPAAVCAPAARPVSKRDFLFGSAPRADRGP
jgi:[NiFe] hydrogenase assembly HybE family chaperone